MTIAPITRASTAPRWMFCHESAWLEQQYPDMENPAASEGIAAHEMAELVLTDVVGNVEELVDRQASNGVMFVGEMVDHVMMYVDHVRSRGVAYWVEESISIVTQDGEVPGRCDGAAFSFDQRTGILYIDDFKYGHRLVDIFENWQELIYSIGMYLKPGLGNRITKVVMTIIQPRGYHHDGPIRSWTITIAQLLEYASTLYATILLVHSENRQARSGPWCRDCKVLRDCNVAKAASMNAIDVIMDALPNTDTPEQVAFLLIKLERASDTVNHTLDAIKARAEAMILNGQSIPGRAYEPGTGNRQFKNNDEAIDICAALGVDITDRKVCTPKEAERRGISKTTLKLIATTPSTPPRLTKRDDKHKINEVFKNE